MRPLTLILSRRGQGLAEYALILSLIAMMAIVALGVMSGAINAMLTNVGAKI